LTLLVTGDWNVWVLLIGWAAIVVTVTCAAGASARRAPRERPGNASGEVSLSVAIYDHSMEFAPPVLAEMLAATVSGAAAFELNSVGMLLLCSIGARAIRNPIGERNARITARLLAWSALGAGALSTIAHHYGR
jgi:hypothetical protein